MKPSKYDGQQVMHVDGAKQVHRGTIIGQSEDGQVVYVRADGMTTGDWHFTVKTAILPPLLENAKNIPAP